MSNDVGDTREEELRADSIESAEVVNAGDAAEKAEGAQAETQAEQLARLQEALEEATAQVAENWDKFMRAQAELDNFARRSKRDLENAHKFALEKFSTDLLDVRDSLEMGLDHAEDEAVDLEKLKEGSRMTLRMLSQVMEKFNIQQIDPVGEIFDPARHEAMTMEPTDEIEPNCVLKVIQKGYMLNERLIRPARVIVARAP